MKFVTNKIEDINGTQGFPKRTLLGAAVIAGAPLELIKMIVEAGADPNAKQQVRKFSTSYEGSEFSILHCAVTGSDTAVIQYLFDNGLDINLAYQNHTLSIADHAAVYSESLDTLRLIIKKSNKGHLVNKNGNTPLHYAAVSCDDRSSQIKLLIEQGIEVKSQNNNGQTPIASFLDNSIWIPGMEEGPHISNLKTIIQLGGDPNLKDNQTIGSTHFSSSPLSKLARGGLDEETTVEAARLLVSAGAEIDALDSLGYTPLYDAVGNDNGLVKCLLECGADPNYRASSYSDTPFAKAVKSPFSNETVDDYIELIEIFLNAGCDPRAEVFERRGSSTAAKLIIKRLEKHSFDLQNLEAGSPIRALLKA